MKVVNNMNTIIFNIDTNNLSSNGETRRFTITGDPYSVFSLEVRNEDGNYYNFNTELFQSSYTSLQNQILENTTTYTNSIVFPTVTDADKYDFYLFADSSRLTKHEDYQEVRLGDGTIDINASRGSNSNLLRKTIYQTLGVTLTLSAESPSSLTGWGSVSITNDTITSFSGKNTGKLPFKVVVTSAATRAITINRQPLPSDLSTYVTRTIGSAPVLINKEDQYPTVTNTDTVDGAVTSGIKVVMDNNVADNMSVGDRVTGNSDLDGSTVVTVAELDPDGDNPKEFSLSQAIAISDGTTLSFTNQKNYRWPVNNVFGLTEGMLVRGTNVTSDTKISNYTESQVINSGTDIEQTIVDFTLPPIDNVGAKPSISRNATSFVQTITQTGNVIFNNQQVLALASDSVKFYAYGSDQIFNLQGFDVILSDLKVELTEVTTTTTSGVSASTSIPVAERAGILDNVSTISGIGIDPKVADPTVASGAGTVSGAGTIVASAAQTLENGITLTFPGASRIATITGNITVNNVGDSNTTLYFDLEKFLNVT